MKSTALLFCLLPFFCCMGGYFMMSFVMNATDVVAPDIVGRLLPEALSQLSDLQLYGHIIAEQEDADIAEGTVIEQMPAPYCRMKARQSVGLVIIKKPRKVQAFHALGRSVTEIAAEAERRGIRIKAHELALEGIIGSCYAQYPRLDQEILDRAMHIYSIKYPPSWYSMPDFTGLPIDEVRQLVAPFGLKIKIFHDSLSEIKDIDSSLWVVKDQKPASGEVIDRKSTHTIHLHIVKKNQPIITM